MSTVLKGVQLAACSSIIFAVSGIPIKYGFATGKQLITVPFTEIKGELENKNNSQQAVDIEKKEQKVLVLGNSKSEISLTVDNLWEKVKGRGKKVSFKEVGFKFGSKSLAEKDVLASPCQDNKYYFAKYKGGRLGLDYELEDKSIVNTFNCRDSRYKTLKHVTLDWAKPKEGGSILSLSSITVGSCTFSPMNDSKVKIQCHQFWDSRKKGWGTTVEGILTFSEQAKTNEAH